ncbi:MAG: PAS domain S-box protein [Gammaproteobacteria bacterium]|nr:PAS domain S-box protein [Gammaproteobacteria bacterium]
MPVVLSGNDKSSNIFSMLKKDTQLTLQDRIDRLNTELSSRQQTIAHFRQIFESIPDGVLSTDSEQRIIMVNQAMESLFGYKDEELLGRDIDILFSSRDDYLKLGRTLFPPGTQEQRNPQETPFRKKDGTIFTAEIIGTPVNGVAGESSCFLYLLRDITRRKSLENNLRQLEVKFRTVADFAYDWEWWIRPDGSFRYMSPSCKRITGYAADQFMDNPALLRQIILPKDRKIWDRHRLEETLQIERRELEFRIVRHDGEVRWIEHACQAVIGNHNEFLGYRSSNRDITKRKNYEEELRKALFEVELYREQLEVESAYLQEEIKLSYNHDNIIGDSDALQQVLYKIEQIAITDTTVLLLGETGTGKELFARAIHNTSQRKNRPLVKINCATLPADLIESELFGHEQGAFTTALSKQIGRFEVADKATIFLDEIGELPLELQAKLLRVVQEGEFERLGSTKTMKVDVRIIAATNRDLKTDVEKGRFRQDLWYRLNVFPITLPPLRDRLDDIPQLTRHFTDHFARKQAKKINTISTAVINKLQQYSWPGNIRELENVIERAVINTANATLHLADELKQPATRGEVPGTTGKEAEGKTLEEVERDYIIHVLETVHWKVSGKNSASEILGLKRSTLRARMDKYNIKKP